MTVDVRTVVRRQFTLGLRRRAFLALLALVVLLAAGGACGGRVADDPRIRTSCALPSSDSSVLTPHFVCTASDGNGDRHAVFSYDNTGSAPVAVPIGPANLMFPAPLGRGQPTTFSRGKNVGYFAVRMPEGNVSWVLGSGTATASASGPTCAGA